MGIKQFHFYMYIHNLIITLNYIAIWAKLFCIRWIYSSVTQTEPHLTTQSKVNTAWIFVDNQPRCECMVWLTAMQWCY